jgi:CheY-like chemotaxis protein
VSKLLVVDDEPSVRELISTLLSMEGYEVESARNGLEALERCERSVPDAIVLDLAMPEMDGWHFLEELYKRGLRHKTRVVIVSAWAEDEMHPVDARHKLAKPFHPEALIRVVEDALEQGADELYERKQRTQELSKLLRKIDELA